MGDTIPTLELPEFATRDGRLLASIAYARDCVSYRMGYEVEVASIVPVTRDHHINMCIVWRRKPPGLQLISDAMTRTLQALGQDAATSRGKTSGSSGDAFSLA